MGGEMDAKALSTTQDYLDKRYLAELVGTFALIFVGCASITISGFGGAFPLAIPFIGLAFGLTVMAMAYGLGPISGAHLNPAVTVAFWASGRMGPKDAISYIVAQRIGALVGAGLLLVFLKSKSGGYDVANGLGQTGWKDYSVWAAMLSELVATLLFALVILNATSEKGATPVAGLAIGLTLTVLHLAFINVSGCSVNPARSLGPAVFVGGTALKQLWLFLLVPTVAGAISGWLVRAKILDA
jgi:aquaporin Z